MQWPSPARQASPPGARDAAWHNDTSGAAAQDFAMPASPSPQPRPHTDPLSGSDATLTASPLGMEPQGEAIGAALVAGANTEAWPPAWPSDAQMPPLPCAATSASRASASPSQGPAPVTTSASSWPAKFDSDIGDPWQSHSAARSDSVGNSEAVRKRSQSDTDEPFRVPDGSPLKPCRSRSGVWSAASDHLRSPWDKAKPLGDSMLQTSGVLVEVASGRRASEKQSLLA